MASTGPDVLVVGAGVIGLTVGVRLAELGLRVRIRTESLPAESSSAASGAIWDPGYVCHPSVRLWAVRTHDVFVRLADDQRAGIRLVNGTEASRDPMCPPEWTLSLPGFRGCVPSELLPGFVSGWRYTAPLIDMTRYLSWLQGRLQATHGEIRLGRLRSLDEGLAEARVLVNCSGMGARELVPDGEMRPIRGQLVAVRNPDVTEFFIENTAALRESTYLLPQGDVLLLGGSAQAGESDLVPDRQVARAIVERCSELFPAVATAEILGHRVGIRPYRPEIRLEHVSLGDRHIVHNYGHGGSGVSVSWGCADDIAEIVLGLLG